MSRFFFYPSLQEGLTVSLTIEESRHLRANRTVPGSTIQLGDGQGNLFSGIFIGFYNQHAQIEIQQKVLTVQVSHQIWVWQPLLKNESRMEWVLEKLSEIGVSGIGFFPTERTVKERLSPLRRERWRKIAAEACKQSGRLIFPDLIFCQSWDYFLSRLVQTDVEKVVGDAGSSKTLWSFLTDKMSCFDMHLIVGPEGDFSEKEKSHLHSLPQVSFLNFSHQILRSETASLFGAIVCAAWQEYCVENSHQNLGMQGESS
jgi:16S rRNA (uracil1498-N3)-methyltransferase